MKCEIFFEKICKFLNLAVLISSSKFIMTSRLLNNKRGENYIYSALNKQGVYQYWRCLEYRRENCSAVAKTFIEGKEILNLPEHSHPSDITQINFLLAECDVLNNAIENPALKL